MFKEFTLVLKNKSFRFLWASQILSQLTINVMNFLLLTKLYQQTGSTVAVSMLWVAYSLPAILVGPIGAASVDLMSRRKTLIITNLLQALTIFIYALLHREKLFLLYGIVLTYSFLNQFYVPAEASSLPSLVSKKSLAQANSLFFLTQEASLVVGFGLAGGLNQFLGFANSLYLCALMVFLAFISTVFLPEIKIENKIPKDFEKALSVFFEGILEGYHFIKNRKNIYLPFFILMGIQIIVSVVTINVPVIATDLLEMPLNSAGVLLVVPAGLGALIGAISTSKMLARGIRKKAIIENSLISTSFGIFCFSFIIPYFPYTFRIIFSFLILILIGAAFVGIVIPAQTFLQEVTPEGLRGRVFGNFWFLVTIATVFPVIFSGTITELFGVNFLLAVITGISFTTYLLSKRYGQKFILNE
jgi:MFS family permease